MTMSHKMAFFYAFFSLAGFMNGAILHQYSFDTNKKQRLEEQEESVKRQREYLEFWKREANKELHPRPDLIDYHKENIAGRLVLAGIFGTFLGGIIAAIANMKHGVNED